jgi:hypothetical protein
MLARASWKVTGVDAVGYSAHSGYLIVRSCRFEDLQFTCLQVVNPDLLDGFTRHFVPTSRVKV